MNQSVRRDFQEFSASTQNSLKDAIDASDHVKAYGIFRSFRPYAPRVQHQIISDIGDVCIELADIANVFAKHFAGLLQGHKTSFSDLLKALRAQVKDSWKRVKTPIRNASNA